jgi:phage repressor protein C with HTH and peptisase S24 domain
MKNEKTEIRPSPVGERLQSRIDELDLSMNAACELAVEYAASVGSRIGDTYVRDVCTGRIQDPGGEKLNLAARAFGLNPSWLAYETGEKFLHGAEKPSAKIINPQKFGDLANKNKLFIPPTIDRQRGVKNMALYGKLRAGSDGYEMLADPIDWIEPPENMQNRDGCFAMLVKGNSMHKAVPDGGTVYVDPYKQPIRGRLAMIVTKDNLGYIKRFISKSDTHWVFEQDEPAGELKFAHGEVADVFRIRGSNYDD